MNVSKYIELLRFYVTDKIDQTNQSLKDSFENEIEDVLSSILSAVFSMFISVEVIKTSGFWETLLRVLIVIVSFILLKIAIKRIRRYVKSYLEEKASDKSEITKCEAKALVDKFDHIACDGILLSRDYYQKYIDTDKKSINEKRFYLFESFYYFKKALGIVELVVQYSNMCINGKNNINGISMYRFSNVFKSLDELLKVLSNSIDQETDIEYHEELKNEMIKTKNSVRKIEHYLVE